MNLNYLVNLENIISFVLAHDVFLNRPIRPRSHLFLKNLEVDIHLLRRPLFVN